jgi:hypothetical protein
MVSSLAGRDIEASGIIEQVLSFWLLVWTRSCIFPTRVSRGLAFIGIQSIIIIIFFTLRLPRGHHTSVIPLYSTRLADLHVTSHLSILIGNYTTLQQHFHFLVYIGNGGHTLRSRLECENGKLPCFLDTSR